MTALCFCHFEGSSPSPASHFGKSKVDFPLRLVCKQRLSSLSMLSKWPSSYGHVGWSGNVRAQELRG